MEEVLRDVERPFKGFAVYLRLLSSSMTIEVSVHEDEKIFYTNMSNDSMTEELRELFNNYIQVFEYLAEGNFDLQGPSRIILLAKVMKKIKRIPIHLIEKRLTRQMMLEKKVDQLQKQIQQLRDVERNNKELHSILQNTIDKLRLRNSQLEKQHTELQKQLQTANHKLLLKQEAMKQAKHMKAQTISGEGYEELYKNVVKTEDKSQITLLYLENTVIVQLQSSYQIKTHRVFSVINKDVITAKVSVQVCQ